MFCLLSSLRVLLILSQPPFCFRGELLGPPFSFFFLSNPIGVLVQSVAFKDNLVVLVVKLRNANPVLTCLCPPCPQEQQRQGSNVLCRKGDGCEPAARRARRPGSTVAGRVVSSGGDGRRMLHASLATIQLQTGQTEAEEQRREGGAGVRLRAQPAPRSACSYWRLRLRDISVPLNLLDSRQKKKKKCLFFKVSAAPSLKCPSVYPCLFLIKGIPHLRNLIKSLGEVFPVCKMRTSEARPEPGCGVAPSFIHPQAPPALQHPVAGFGTDKQRDTPTFLFFI